MQCLLHYCHRLPGNVVPAVIRSDRILQQRLGAMVDYVLQQLPLAEIRLLTVE
jgi:hypothetical protein